MDEISRYSLHCVSAGRREETINESGTWGDTESLLDWYRSVKPLGQTITISVRADRHQRIVERVTVCGLD